MIKNQQSNQEMIKALEARRERLGLSLERFVREELAPRGGISVWTYGEWVRKGGNKMRRSSELICEEYLKREGGETS